MADDRALPTRYRVVSRSVETRDSVTMTLAPATTPPTPLAQFTPGQFMMLYAYGVGEVAISVSGDPSATDGTLVHTIRDVGAVSRALHDAPLGTIIGVRGLRAGLENGRRPGSRPRDRRRGSGIGAPAPGNPRRAGHQGEAPPAHSRRRRRTPADILYRAELETWRARTDLAVELTIDQPIAGWTGGVGFVTEALHRVDLDPERTTALLCGPEPMMRFCARALTDRLVSPHDIQVSVERNMQCGIGACGHCQLGELLLCRDGPVVDYATAEPLLRVPEL